MTEPQTWGFRSSNAAADHFLFHKDDENHRFESIEEYGGMALAFRSLPISDDVIGAVRRNGQEVKYHRVTQEFMMLSPSGFIVAYYFLKPNKGDWASNEAHFRQQCRRS